MTVKEIYKKHTFKEIESFPGDNQLRYELFSPLFNNLYESKVVYRERFIGIVKLENIILNPIKFSAKVIPHLLLERESHFDQFFFGRTWECGSIWSHIRLSERYSLNSPYANWGIWCDPETVRKTEELILKKEFTKAMLLINEI